MDQTPPTDDTPAAPVRGRKRRAARRVVWLLTALVVLAVSLVALRQSLLEPLSLGHGGVELHLHRCDLRFGVGEAMSEAVLVVRKGHRGSAGLSWQAYSDAGSDVVEAFLQEW